MENLPINHLRIVYKTHLDIGFTQLARDVIRDYFEHLIPKAINTAKVMREMGRRERFIWTSGSWLIYEYLEQASPQGRLDLEKAITAGDIAWHALPFTLHSELLDESLFRHGLGLSGRLDARFGRRTLAAKMSDVPGHTVGIVPLLQDAGVKFLHIGANGSTKVPTVPPLFRWKHGGGSELVVMFHNSYGGYCTIPGTHNVAFIDVTGDNVQPPAPLAVLMRHDQLSSQYPGAELVGSTLDDVWADIEPVAKELPAVEGEMGDTWIHGSASAPQKMIQFRRLAALRRSWQKAGIKTTDAEAFDRFSRKLLLIPEHTWGADGIVYFSHRKEMTANAFSNARDCTAFKFAEQSWREQRSYLKEAVEELRETSLWKWASESIDARNDAAFSGDGASGRTLLGPHRYAFEAFDVELDGVTGAVISARLRASGIQLVVPSNPFGMVTYESFTDGDHKRFIEEYMLPSHRNEWWAELTFGKPGMKMLGDTRCVVQTLAQRGLSVSGLGLGHACR